jgi:tetratricopeptide (TPR) repeat protein
MELYVLVLLVGIAFVVQRMRRKPQPESVVLHVMLPQPERRSGIGPAIVGAIVLAILIGAILALWPHWPGAQTGQGLAIAGTISQPAPLTAQMVLASPTSTAAPEPPADSAALNERGKELIRRGGYAQAEQLFRQAIAADQHFYEPYNNLAFCLYERGATAEATSSWRQALDLYDSADANAGLGMALFVSGQQDEGRSYYQHALGLDASYADEEWMRTERMWSAQALADSRALR